MKQLPDQKSAKPTQGPARTNNRVIGPIVEDIENLFAHGDDTVDQVDSLWLEFKKVVYRGEQGAGLGEFIVFANGVLAERDADGNLTELP